MKKSLDNIIFNIGVFLIPFDNLFFAPSRGWATIAPILFFIYLLLNIKNIKLYSVILLFLAGLATSLINFFIVGFDPKCTFESLVVLLLGFSSFYSFMIYYEKNRDLNKIAKILTYSYLIAIIVGVIQFISVKFNVSFFMNMFDTISKRNYLRAGRVQFTFTEPSFIGMHVYGVILPIYLLTKNKKMLIEIFVFVVLALVFGSGLRIILDTMVVIGIFIVNKYKNNKKQLLLCILFLPLIVGTVSFSYNYLYEHNGRFRNIADRGSNGDPSAASRQFRIDASFYGYERNIPHALFGYGIGNSTLAIRDGYEPALEKFKNDYKSEIMRLKYSYDDNASYNLYIRLLSEYGLIWLIAFSCFIIKLYIKSNFSQKFFLSLVVLYLYIQFDSYGFYTIWLLIVILYYTSKNKLNYKSNIII